MRRVLPHLHRASLRAGRRALRLPGAASDRLPGLAGSIWRSAEECQGECGTGERARRDPPETFVHPGTVGALPEDSGAGGPDERPALSYLALGSAGCAILR
jgi:hypothetical protein